MTSQELQGFLADARARLLATVEAAAPERLTRRPAPERWSPLEVFEHVALAEQWFVQVVAGLIAEGTSKGLRFQAGMTRDMDALAALAAQIDIRKPLVAPTFIQPTGKASVPELREKLGRSRQALLDLLPALDGLDTDRLTYKNPAQPFALNAYQWVHLSGVHERLHTRQIRQALETVS